MKSHHGPLFLRVASLDARPLLRALSLRLLP
jgi:hypothetical protein